MAPIHAEALQATTVSESPKVPTWRLEWDSNLRSSIKLNNKHTMIIRRNFQYKYQHFPILEAQYTSINKILVKLSKPSNQHHKLSLRNLDIQEWNLCKNLYIRSGRCIRCSALGLPLVARCLLTSNSFTQVSGVL